MSFILLLLDWYHVHKRPLPWRLERKVFNVWLSEIILQQTRVNQGLNYYEKFVKHFSDVHELAKADEQLILNLWQGLGYYTRARNLHKTAKIVSNEHQAVFPQSFEGLKKLPGIGPYTAAAIASICYDEKVPAIDGNAYRVYARLFALNKDISDSNAHKFFFNYVLDIMPDENTGDFNEAIMELGATICLPQSPKCSQCPIVESCVAFQTGSIDKYPVKTKKVKVRKRNFHYFFVFDVQTNEFLVQKRVDKDVWQNLYDLPMIETKTKKYDASLVPQDKVNKVAELKHILTHQHLNIQFYEFNGTIEEFLNISDQDLIRIKASDIEHTPFPKPIASFLAEKFPEMV